MTETDGGFFAIGLVAVACAAAWDAAPGEYWPSVGGLFVGPIVGVMAFG